LRKITEKQIKKIRNKFKLISMYIIALRNNADFSSVVLFCPRDSGYLQVISAFLAKKNLLALIADGKK
jgi:hypothetical protein